MPEQIREALFGMRDETYRSFQIKLIPTVDPDAVIGVRTPALRAMAAEMIRSGEAEAFLLELPHAWFDENQLHAFILSEMKDFSRCLESVNRFLPHIDNWATCDQLSPKAFRKRPAGLLEAIRGWMASGEVYTVRFGIGMLMAHYLDEAFDPAYPEWVANIRSEAYYVRMMIAWYFATALAKQYPQIVPYLENRRLDTWTHNKAIQKAVESRRISPEQKKYLKHLRVR